MGGRFRADILQKESRCTEQSKYRSFLIAYAYPGLDDLLMTIVAHR